MGETPYPESRGDVVPRRLYRSRTNRTFAGVCGGLAEYFAADPTAVRLAAVLIALITGIFPGLLVYVIAAIVVPERPMALTEQPMEAGRPGQGALLVGILLVVVGSIALAERVFQVDWDVVWPAALIAIGAVLAVFAVRR
jgi:phage shock protein C